MLLSRTMRAGVKSATQGPGVGENFLFWLPGPTAAPRRCRGCAAPPAQPLPLPCRGVPGARARRGDTEQGHRAHPALPRGAQADSSDGRGARPGESRPACSYLLSAWARTGNVRKVNNKYLGNEAGAGAGWGLSRAPEVVVAGGCCGCGRNPEHCQLPVFPEWGTVLGGDVPPRPALCCHWCPCLPAQVRDGPRSRAQCFEAHRGSSGGPLAANSMSRCLLSSQAG